jgi:phosphoadenosine phosphosulfate reductase
MSELESNAIKRIEVAYEMSKSMGNDLIVAYSGGKDSDVLLNLALKSGCPFIAQHNHTTVDAPPRFTTLRKSLKNCARKILPRQLTILSIRCAS